MANNAWVGNAVNIYQEDTITVAGTWAGDDIATLTINGNALVITIGTGTATTAVAAAICNGINATSRTDNLDSDETRNLGGQEIPEFTELIAAVSGAVVTVNGATAGVPYTLTVAKTTAGDGTATLASVVSCTGKSFFDNIDNWSLNAVPVDGDKIIFQGNAVDCLYNLTTNAATNNTVQIDGSYTGKIGLKSRNDIGYDEYRPQHLLLKTSSVESSIVIGEGPGSGSQRIKINTSDAPTVNAVIASTGQAESGQKAAVDFIGSGGNVTLSIRRGSLSIAADSTNTATVNELDIAYETQVASDARVIVGDNATITTIVKTGGFLQFINSANSVTTLRNDAGEVDFNGVGGITTLNINGGKVVYNSTGTISACNLRNNGWIDFTHDNRTKTITVIDRYSDASGVDDSGGVVAAMVIDNNNVSDTSNLRLGNNYRITRGAVA